MVRNILRLNNLKILNIQNVFLPRKGWSLVGCEPTPRPAFKTMWLFPWNPNADFYSNYEIEEHITSFNGRSIWTLFRAKKKGFNEPLSIFRFDFKEPNSKQVDRAKQSLKRIKTLRHPSILKYVDSYESEKSICIVTEAVTPLADYLEAASNLFTQTQREFSIAYGLQKVAKGLHFINNDCQLNHNNINIHSVFVNNSGEWKIGGLEYVCPVEESPPRLEGDLSEKYTPPERLDAAKSKHPGAKYAVDSWGLGCLVWESFNKPLTPSSSVKTVGKMPKPLSVYYNKLVQSSPRHRTSPLDFIKECREANVFFGNPLLETILYLEEIQLVKDPNEKAKFFNRLENELESFPNDICKNRILPDLICAYEYGEAGSSILNPIFRIGKLLTEDEYQSKLVPCIIKFFACKDRATRSKLLKQLDSYINFIAPNVINEQIFPQVVQGFLDSNLTIREQTVKSMLYLAPKLNSSNLNEELMKHFARILARDEEGGIRANTTVCLGKIATFLSSQVQQTAVLPSFLRVLRDPFPPARHAAIAAICANESLFELKECVTKIMPALCHMCIDSDVNVRKLTFKAVRLFLDKAEAEGDKDEANTSAGPLCSNTPNHSIPQSAQTSSISAIRPDMKSLSIKD